MIKLLLATIILFSLINSASTQQSNHREIYLFAESLNDASFIAQKSILDDVSGLKERDIQVHEVIGSKANAAVFKKYKASTLNFTFILIGKDGGEKLRSNKPISLKKLYGTIDAMPMRKGEMQNKP